MEIEDTILSEIELAQEAKRSVDLKVQIGEGEDALVIEKTVPQNVAGLDQATFGALATLYFPPKFLGRDIYFYDFLMHLCSFNKTVWELLDAETIKDLGKLATPFLTDKPICFKNLVPEIEIPVKKKKVTYYGVDNGLTGLVFDEYILMELNFDKYLETKDEKYLSALASVFFRPKGTTFKEYLKNEEDFVAFAEQHIDRKQKAAALFAYQCMRNYLSNRFARVFRSGGESGESKKGWRKTIVRLAGEKFGTPDKVRYSLLYDVMEELDDRLANKPKQK